MMKEQITEPKMTTNKIVAARSRAAAARALKVSSGHLAKYGSITGNIEEIQTAISKPGVAFERAHGFRGDTDSIRSFKERA
jgi:hypothetical protein